jgi:hypothetical protein
MGKQIERDEKATQLRDEIQKLRGGYRKRKLPNLIWKKVLECIDDYSRDEVCAFLEVSTQSVYRQRSLAPKASIKKQLPSNAAMNERKRNGARQGLRSFVSIPLPTFTTEKPERVAAEVAVEVGFAQYGQVRIELSGLGCGRLSDILKELSR